MVWFPTLLRVFVLAEYGTTCKLMICMENVLKSYETEDDFSYKYFLSSLVCADLPGQSKRL